LWLASSCKPKPIVLYEAERLDEPVPGLEPFRVRDLVRVGGSDEETVLRFITLVADAMRASSSGVVVNTFSAIEGPELARIRGELSRPAFAVGPLHLLCPPRVERGPHAPGRGCLPWLDARPPRSVLYVSLGSVARIHRAVLEEMAGGLAGSGVPFLWVLRGGPEQAPPSLHDAVGRHDGKVVTWAPQREVLAHPSVGGFWTHCGWNSVMEALCEGVPVLAHPRFADHTVSARYVTHRWRVGLRVGKVMDSANIANAIRRLMLPGEEGAAGEGAPSQGGSKQMRCGRRSCCFGRRRSGGVHVVSLTVFP
jgi:UDP-glucosyltransferase BX8/BX9